MLPILLLWLALAPPTDTSAITLQNFDEAIFGYLPERVEEVDEATYDLWIARLKETYALAERDGAFNIGDYFNFTSAFRSLKADPELIRLAFLRAAEVDPEGWREYMEQLPHHFDERLPEEYASFMAGSSSLAAKGRSKPESRLQRTMEWLRERDKRHRGKQDFLSDPKAIEAQRALDVRNAAVVDSLVQAHGAYVGRSLVGEEYEATMWAVVQHSNLEMMQRFLPIVHQAVRANELGEVPLRMLIDREHAIRTGTQVFGSQEGVPLADEATRDEVRARYGL